MADVALRAQQQADGDEAARAAARLRRPSIVFFYLPLAWLCFVSALAVLAPVLALQDPNALDFLALEAPPSAEHWLGTDVLGRDILARVTYGARVSLTVGFAAPGVALVLGLCLGMLAGYFRGWTDELIGTAIDTWLAVPGLVILLLFSLVFGGSLTTVCIALGLLFIPATARISRAATLTFAQREFVIAARAMGAGHLRIMLVEIFPNVIWPVVAFVMVAIPLAIVVEGTLSFLGLSVPSPTPSWGGMIAEGREHLQTAPHIALIPTAAMFLTVLSFNLVGDYVRRRLADVRDSAI